MDNNNEELTISETKAETVPPARIGTGRRKKEQNEKKPLIQEVFEWVEIIALSLSFTHDVATAMALLVTDEVRPQPKVERDPQQELMSSFKQARTVIEELERLQGNL